MYIVSACLAGVKCKYSGGDNKVESIAKLVEGGKAIPVCPEVLGGLSIPRVPCEIVKDEFGNIKVVNKDGKDLTSQFKEGARKTLDIGKAVEANVAILKSNSPSCGYGKIYDGSFSGKLVKGNGITAELLGKNCIKVYNENNFKLD